MKSPSAVRSVGLAALACMLPAFALAQRPAPSESLAAARGRALAALRPGQAVRLRIAGDGRVQGRFLGLSGDTVLLAAPTAPQRVAAPAVETLWVRGRRTTLGAVVGGTVGAAGTGSVLYLVGAILCGASGGQDCRPGTLALIGVIGGGLGGALMGGAVGTLFPRWRREFP